MPKRKLDKEFNIKYINPKFNIKYINPRTNRYMGHSLKESPTRK